MFLTTFPTVKKASLQEPFSKNKVRCLLCERKCVVIEGKRGFCETRENVKGELYTLVYGDIAAEESRPIEIKPFYHYYPGSTAYTIATFSCNFRCPWCQNFHLSRTLPQLESSFFTSPQTLIRKAIESGNRGVCISFTEPTLLFEYALNLFPLAREADLYCCFVSNGYMSEEALKMLIKSGLDGLKVDIKGGASSYRKLGLRDEYPWRNVALALEMGIHVEVVYLVVTGFNDSEEESQEIIKKHLKYGGEDVPFHVNRYFPAYRYREPPTEIGVLKRIAEEARESGVNYVYIGNVSLKGWMDTHCPSCGRIVLERERWGLKKSFLKDKTCFSCGRFIPIYGEISSNLQEER